MPRDVPHTALVYRDHRDRKRLVEPYVRRNNGKWNALTLLTAQPQADAKLFGGAVRKLALDRRRVALSIVDVREKLSNDQCAAKGLLSVLRKELQRRSDRFQCLIMADWTYEVYDDFGIALAVEEAMRQRTNLVCCYRSEGFWSLPCKQIARVFELHSRVQFGSTVFMSETEQTTMRP